MNPQSVSKSLTRSVLKLGNDNHQTHRFLNLWATALRDSCDHVGAVNMFRMLADVSHGPNRRSALAEIAEIHLLQGELGPIETVGTAESC